MLDDLLQVVLEQAGQFVDLVADILAQRHRLQHVIQLVGQLRRYRGKIIDEVERVLDLMRNAGGELAEGSELFGLDQPVLGGAQLVERFCQFLRARLHLIEQAGILDRNDSLVCKCLHQLDLPLSEGARLAATQCKHPLDASLAQQGNAEESAIAANPRYSPEVILGIFQHVRICSTAPDRMTRGQIDSRPGLRGCCFRNSR